MVTGPRRIGLAVATTAVAVVLLFRYPTSLGASTVPAGPVVVAAAPKLASSPAPSTDPSPSASPNPAGTAPGTPAAPVSKTYAGTVADTQWGPVQVQITVSGGKITAADVLQVPNGNPRDDEINAAAVPILDSEVVAAQSAKIDTVSGATVTSDGYLTSLQAAVDAAGL